MNDAHPTVGRCGSTLPLPAGAQIPPINCALPHGHAGWHRDDNGAEWGHAKGQRTFAVEFTTGIAAAHYAAAVAGGEQYLTALRAFGIDTAGMAAVERAQDLSRQANSAWQNVANIVGAPSSDEKSPTVTLPARVAKLLVAGHLNHLHAVGQDEGCCPVCCGPCAALKQLLDAGQLDDIVRSYAVGGWECWDEQAGQVDRAWLAGAWRMTDCHDWERPND